jgi:translocation and assembly module TamB
LVLGAEIGLDFTERFNASVLAAPNRSDVPPQLNLNLKASELLNLQGAIDAQGAWQTQLQLFFRF